MTIVAQKRGILGTPRPDDKGSIRVHDDHQRRRNCTMSQAIPVHFSVVMVRGRTWNVYVVSDPIATYRGLPLIRLDPNTGSRIMNCPHTAVDLRDCPCNPALTRLFL